MDEELCVVTKAVEGVEDGEMFCFVGVEGGRENDAVTDAAGEDFAGDGVAFDAAGGSSREVKEIKEVKEVKDKAEGFAARS